MKYDLVIVSKSTPELKKLTDNCISSARKDGADLNIIVVETSGLEVKYDATVVKYLGDFNYHRALNLGLKEAKGDVYIIANNDIVFEPGWSQIGEQMKINGFDSACGLSSDIRQRSFQRGNWIYPGYIVGSHLVGWCIFLTKECYKTIGQLSEEVSFWYSDNIYADQLQDAGLRHGLFCNVQINHITSQTLRTVSHGMQRYYSTGQQGKYKMIRRAKRERIA